MGKQKQQRRSAKKKKGGGGKKAAAGTKNEAKDETVPTQKCTACRQVVTVDTSIACPVPGCDRIFCTKKCASGCIVRCANEGCLCPERCRPCANGKTFHLVVRQKVKRENGNNSCGGEEDYSKLAASLFTSCCASRVCSICIDRCWTCAKMICLSWTQNQSDRMVACSDSICQAKYCSSACLPDSFDTSWSACGECIANGIMVKQGNREVGVIKGKFVDKVVFEYAHYVSDCFRYNITLMSRMRSMYQIVEPADEAENSVDRMKIIDKILGPFLQAKQEMAWKRITDVTQRCFEEFCSMRKQGLDGLESRVASCCDEVMTALLPDITASIEAFSRLKFFLSSEDHSFA